MVLQSLAGLPAFLVYFCTAIIAVLAYLFIYTRITPHNEFDLIRNNNPAAASAGTPLVEQQGPYGAEGFIRQALAPLPSFSGQYAVIGSWLVDHTPCGLSVREDGNPITGNTSRFLPHAIL